MFYELQELLKQIEEGTISGDDYNEDNEIDEAVATKDKAGNVQYYKSDSEASIAMNQARQKGVQLTKQTV